MNLTLTTGPYDVATLRNDINTILNQINAQAPGALNSQAGSVGNAADATDDTLYSYVIAANNWASYFPSAQPYGLGGIRITAWGTSAANGQNKTVKIFFGGTVVISSAVVTINAKSWIAQAVVIRTGISTQKAVGTMQSDATMIAAAAADLTETETAAITVKVTGASPTSSSANDILGKGMLIEAIR